MRLFAVLAQPTIHTYCPAKQIFEKCPGAGVCVLSDIFIIVVLKTHITGYLDVCSNLANHIWIAKTVQVIVLYLQHHTKHCRRGLCTILGQHRQAGCDKEADINGVWVGSRKIWCDTLVCDTLCLNITRLP